MQNPYNLGFREVLEINDNKPLYLWGVKQRDQRYHELGIVFDIDGYIDEDEILQKCGWNGYKVTNLAKLQNTQCYIVISVYEIDVIKELLIKNGFNQKNIFTFHEVHHFYEKKYRTRRIANIAGKNSQQLRLLYQLYENQQQSIWYKNTQPGRISVTTYCKLLDYLYLPEMETDYPHFLKNEVEFSVLIRGNGSILASNFFLNRQDHDQLFFNAIREVPTEQVTVILSANRADHTQLTDFKKVSRTYSLVPQSDDIPLLQEYIGGIQKLNLEINETEYHLLKSSFISSLRQIDFCLHLLEGRKVSAYLATHEFPKTEAALIQLCNSRDIPTFVLQHAFYRTYNQPGQINSISAAYGNLRASKVLAWGKKTAGDLKSLGLKQSRIKIVGNPKYQTTLSSFQIKKLPNQEREVLVVFFLISASYTNSKTINKKLLNLAEYTLENTNYRVKIKPHPLNYIEHYKEEVSRLDNFTNFDGLYSNRETITQSLQEASLCIAENSTVYFEALINGIPCLILNSELAPNLLNNDPAFSFWSINQLYEKMNFWLNTSRDEANLTSIIKKEISQFFKLSQSPASKNYCKLLSNHKAIEWS